MKEINIIRTSSGYILRISYVDNNKITKRVYKFDKLSSVIDFISFEDNYIPSTNDSEINSVIDEMNKYGVE